MNSTRFFAALLSLASFAGALAQETSNPTAEIEAAGRNILSDPRLKNVLRSVKQDPGAALDQARKDPEEAVREATRIFQTNANGIDAEDLKAAAIKAQSDGTLDRAMTKATAAVQDAPAMARSVTGAGSTPPAATTAATQEAGETATQEAGKPALTAQPTGAPPAIVATPASAETVPAATRPAPGISGGAPTPVAMPVTPGSPPPAETEAPVSTLGGNPLPPTVATVVGSDRVVPLAGTSPTVPELPDLDVRDTPAPRPLEKKYHKDAKGGYPGPDKGHMEIRAKESTMDNAKGLLLFTGNVFIDHPEFEIKCDKLEIQLAEGVGMDGSGGGGKSDTNFKRAVASGGMVEIKRIAVDDKGKKKTQIALARMADYNAITKDIVLSGGPPYIQDGEAFVRTESEDAKIIMRGNGLYEIDGSTERQTIRIPIEQKPGQKKGEVGLPGGLDNAFDRFR